MASFDINLLFTNIPLKENIDIAAKELYTVRNTSLFGLSINVFKQLISLACSGILFIFNKTLYSQIDGCAMGNPLGPTMANYFSATMKKTGLRAVLVLSDQQSTKGTSMILSCFSKNKKMFNICYDILTNRMTKLVLLPKRNLIN